MGLGLGFRVSRTSKQVPERQLSTIPSIKGLHWFIQGVHGDHMIGELLKWGHDLRGTTLKHLIHRKPDSEHAHVYFVAEPRKTLRFGDSRDLGSREFTLAPKSWIA